MRYSQLFSDTLNQFKEKDYSLDIQLIFEKAFNLTREQFWLKKNEIITDSNGLKKFYRYRKRLLKNEPVSYILKEKEFYGENFFVNKNVLIPRPETEILVEKTIELTDSFANPVRILDIGAGSGNISIILAKKSKAEVTAIEKSSAALRVLKKNISQHGLTGKITITHGDLFPARQKPFDIIVSNPPYIPEKEWQELESNVRDFEPKQALTAGRDGLFFIRQITQSANKFLTPRGILLMEIGYNQKDSVEKLFTEFKFYNIQFFNDYSGIPRIAFAQLNETFYN